MPINPGSARRMNIPKPDLSPMGGTPKPTRVGGDISNNPARGAGRMNGGGQGGNTQPHTVPSSDGGYVPGHSSIGGQGRQD